MNVTCNRATRPGASEKAQAVPIIGALGGAAVNYAFIDHFQEIALLIVQLEQGVQVPRVESLLKGRIDVRGFHGQ